MLWRSSINHVFKNGGVRWYSSGPKPLMVVSSVGNPEAKYGQTRHNAGHEVLNRVVGGEDKFRREGQLKNVEIYEASSDLIYLKSRTFMNISGDAIVHAWKRLEVDHRGREVLKIVLHDELSLAPGRIELRMGESSLRGHRGLRSIAKTLGNTDFVRIGIGIGRPESRDPKDVAEYVLGRMSRAEIGETFDVAVPKIMRLLLDISKGSITAGKR